MTPGLVGSCNFDGSERVATAGRGMTMTYQQDLRDRRELLNTWLSDASADLDAAREALHRLTLLDGPQHVAVGSGIAAAQRAVHDARVGLEVDPTYPRSTTGLPAWVEQFYADVLLHQQHVPTTSPLTPARCVACTAQVGRAQAWPCPIAAAAPARARAIVEQQQHERIGA